MRNGLRLFSIGHSNHELAEFLRLLHLHAITVLADVRSAPYSQRYPQYNRQPLEQALAAAGIQYLFLGDLLGGRPDSREVYDDDGRVDYEKVRDTDFFRRGVEQLISGLDDCTMTMMCSEADPLDCHRGLMIAPSLVERGIAPGHIRKDGSVEGTAEMEKRLLAATHLESGMLDGLFADSLEEERQWLLGAAYRAMAKKKAFRQSDV